MSRAEDKRVLCVGMCVADIIHVCEDFPVEDSDKRCKHGRWQRGGNASNNCTVLRRLGRPADFLGPLSRSPLFTFLLVDMQQRGIAYDACPMHECDAPLSSVILNERTGSRTIIHSNPGVPPLRSDDFEQVDLRRYAWVHFEGRQTEDTLRMMQRIRAYNEQRAGNGSGAERIVVSLDIEKTALDFGALLPFVDVAFVGKDYARERWQCDSKLEAVRRLRAEAATSAAPNVAAICPWGDSGAALIDPLGAEFQCEAYAADGRPIVDSLGAGDTFLAAVVHYLCGQPDDWAEALRFGCQMAGGKIRHVGYDCVTDLQTEWLQSRSEQ